jgi:hypothetical protein
MTTYQGIAVVTQAFGYLIGTAVRQAVPEAVVTLDPPEQQPAASRDEPRTNVYLVHVERDPVFSMADLPMRDPKGTLVGTPQVALDLRYLVSFFGPPPKSHLMLGAVQIAVHEQAFLTPKLITAACADRPDLHGSRLEDQLPPVQLAAREVSLEELTRFWSGFTNARFTLSVLFEASPVLLATDDVIPPPPNPDTVRPAASPIGTTP